MKDLLKEAIADAKAVRETALANAKLALEEAFTPRLQSMLSAKLSEELDDDAEMTNEWGDEGYADNNKRFDEGEDDHETNHDEPEEDDDLDLEEIIRELEEDENTDSMYEEGMDDEDEMDEDIDINEIIRSLKEEEDSDEDEMHKDSDEDEEDSDEDEMDEDIDINEIIRSLKEEDEEEGKPWAEPEKASEESGELEEAYSVIRFLKSKINEVNLLNAKLLYSNKLFRNFSLNESQKMKVIENFDRAYNLREVKLVYSTLAEGFKIPSTKKVVKESFASKPVASTKPAGRIISEGTELSNRFKKLAGLK
jgi:hypothetical protein